MRAQFVHLQEVTAREPLLRSRFELDALVQQPVPQLVHLGLLRGRLLPRTVVVNGCLFFQLLSLVSLSAIRAALILDQLQLQTGCLLRWRLLYTF